MKLGAEVFKPGICWAVVHSTSSNARVFVPEHLCGHPATEYLATRERSIIVTKMFLCMTHKAHMEKKGYILRLTK